MKELVTKVKQRKIKEVKIDYPIFFMFVQKIEYELIEQTLESKYYSNKNFKPEHFYKNIIKI